jgi:hypothetical protein
MVLAPGCPFLPLHGIFEKAQHFTIQRNLPQGKMLK